MRVHELAKELNLTSKDLLDKIHADLKLDAKNHMATLTVDQVSTIRKKLAVPVAAPVAVAAAPSPTPVAPAPAPAPAPSAPAKKDEPEDKVLVIKPLMIVRELAELMGIKPNLLIAELMGMNIFASINQKIELKTIQALAERHGFKIQQEKKVVKPVEPPPEAKPPEVVEKEGVDQATDMLVRPPVVAFMGHVDHGKTSLLDKIRNAKVAAGEDGGITQHIGAYTVKSTKGFVTFLDTPGHEAFTKMRARGANLTDIVVIVVDAVDGLMPQTREAIQHAKAAKVSIMVAINKMDLRAANPDRVRQQLQSEGLTPDTWGGETVCCPVSALTGEGVDNLLEMISLQAEMLELKANPRRHAQGFVIEARLEPGMGPTATLLVRKGTLKVGDAVIVGPHWGKVKALVDDQGKKVKDAGPSYAVKCLGLSGVPEAGSEFVVMDDEREARALSEQRQQEIREKSLANAQPKRASIESLLELAAEGDKKELNVIIKADVQGSIEAIHHVIDNIKSTKVSIKLLLTGVGNITNNDILLASASNAVVIGFHVSLDNGVRSLAKREGVEIKLYNIIYELVDDLKNIMVGMLDPIVRENVHGQVLVKQVFDMGKKGKVAGCIVKSGRITSRSRARVMRQGDVIFQGAVSNLKRFQNDAGEVREGQECGVRLDNFGSFEIGDVIEVFDVERINQQL